MSLSLSVCVFVCVSVVIFSRFEALDVLEARCLKGVINVSNRCPQGCLKVFKEFFKDAIRMFKDDFMGG